MKKSLPNILTISRIAVIPCIILAFYIPGKFGNWLCFILFAAASITDYFDGMLARAWQVQSKIGKIFDPIADKLLVATAIVLLVHQDRAHILPAIAILCREIMVSGLREYLAEINISMPVSSLAKFKTAFQMIALCILLLGDAVSGYINAEFWGNLLLWIAAILTLITGYAYLRLGISHAD